MYLLIYAIVIIIREQCNLLMDPLQYQRGHQETMNTQEWQEQIRHFKIQFDLSPLQLVVKVLCEKLGFDNW